MDLYVHKIPMAYKSCSVTRGGSENLLKGAVHPVAFRSPFLSLSSIPALPSLIEAGPFKSARGSGERCKLPQRGPGGAPAENEFGALQRCKKATGGNHFQYSEYHVL